MVELIIICEGQTEERFVTDVLAPALAPTAIYASARMIPTSPNSRGGSLNYDGSNERYVIRCSNESIPSSRRSSTCTPSARPSAGSQIREAARLPSEQARSNDGCMRRSSRTQSVGRSAFYRTCNRTSSKRCCFRTSNHCAKSNRNGLRTRRRSHAYAMGWTIPSGSTIPRIRRHRNGLTYSARDTGSASTGPSRPPPSASIKFASNVRTFAGGTSASSACARFETLAQRFHRRSP